MQPLQNLPLSSCTVSACMNSIYPSLLCEVAILGLNLTVLHTINNLSCNSIVCLWKKYRNTPSRHPLQTSKEKGIASKLMKESETFLMWYRIYKWRLMTLSTSSVSRWAVNPSRSSPGLTYLHSATSNINYLCTCDLYSPVQNVLGARISITRASRRGLGPGILEFFGPCEMGTSRWICTHPKHYAQGCINHRCVGCFMHTSPLVTLTR